MFETANGTLLLANQTATYPTNYTHSGSGQTTTTNPLTVSSSSSSSVAVYFNSTRISNKKQSKNNNNNNNGNSVTAGLGGFQDQNMNRRIFNGTEQNGNSAARNKEGRQKNNRKQISGASGAALNFDESGQAPGEWSERDSANYTEPKYYLGKLIQGTYCSRVFSDCEKRPCRMQSPNFPGVYPRNLTCFYAVRQVSNEICKEQDGLVLPQSN